MSKFDFINSFINNVKKNPENILLVNNEEKITYK